MRIIKKYENRKLYDTKKRGYTTLAEILQLGKTDEEFTVVDHASGKDLTSATLGQAIFVEENRRAEEGLSPMVPPETYVKIIQEGLQ